MQCEKRLKRSWKAQRNQGRQCPLPVPETVGECLLCLSLGRSLKLADSTPPSVGQSNHVQDYIMIKIPHMKYLQRQNTFLSKLYLYTEQTERKKSGCC